MNPEERTLRHKNKLIMIPKDIKEHIFYLKYGYTVQVAKTLKEESERFKKRKKKSN